MKQTNIGTANNQILHSASCSSPNQTSTS